jgi:hypothetical protein
MVAREVCLHAEGGVSLVDSRRRESFCDLNTYGRLPRGEGRDVGAPEWSSR